MAPIVLPVMKPTIPISTVMIRARGYFTYSDKPKHVRLPAVILPDSVQLPLPEAMQRDIYYQSKTHDLFVRTSIKGKEVTFRVFFKRHHRLFRNPCVEGVRGHILVARSSLRDPQGIVNLRAGDAKVIERILPHVIPMIHNFQSRRKAFRPSVIVRLRDTRGKRSSPRFH